MQAEWAAEAAASGSPGLPESDPAPTGVGPAG
jgi:hypothetical protein